MVIVENVYLSSSKWISLLTTQRGDLLMPLESKTSLDSCRYWLSGPLTFFHYCESLFGGLLKAFWGQLHNSSNLIQHVWDHLFPVYPHCSFKKRLSVSSLAWIGIKEDCERVKLSWNVLLYLSILVQSVVKNITFIRPLMSLPKWFICSGAMAPSLQKVSECYVIHNGIWNFLKLIFPPLYCVSLISIPVFPLQLFLHSKTCT